MFVRPSSTMATTRMIARKSCGFLAAYLERTAPISVAAATRLLSFASASSENSGALMYDVIPKSDHGRFKEYSVIHTDRSLNLMSDPFQRVMRDLNQLLKHTYNADKVAIIPG